MAVLSEYFLQDFAGRYRKPRLSLGDAAMDYLYRYDFKGNVRELRGMIERAVVVCEGRSIDVEDLAGMPRVSDVAATGVVSSAFRAGGTLKALERDYIEHVLKQTGGSIKAASEILGVGRTTLWRKIRDERIDVSGLAGPAIASPE